MREFINILENISLTESRGLGARKPGEEFVSTTNPDDKIYVDRVEFYPADATEYPSYEEMVAELETVTQALGRQAYVDLIGKFKPSDRAFGIAIFKREDGSLLAFVKPFKSIHLDRTQVTWSNQTGIPGFRYNSKAAAKTQAGATPQDILKQKQSDLTAQDIIDQVAGKFGADSPLTKFVQQMAAGQKLPVTIPAVPELGFTAFRDYFCELVHPIALQTGNYSGNAGDAAARFLGKGGFAGASINFGTDKTEGLSDSIMIAPDGKKIRVSSKGAGGAEASSKNLIDAASELDPATAKKYQDTIDIVTEINKLGQSGAPLALGVRYKIISKEDADDIMNFRKMPTTSLTAALQMGISPKLKSLIKDRGTKDPDNLNLYFHSMAAVAHAVAEHVNENTNFSDAASAILNNGALVQVYTKARDGGDAWTVTGFQSVWPSTTVTGVKFSAGKTYYSTGIKGNFTFKILKNGAKDVPDERSDHPEMEPAKPKAAAPSAVTGKRVDIRPKGVKRVEPSNNLGREKR